MREEKIAHRYARALILAIKEDAVLSRIEADLSTLVLLFNAPASGFKQLIENPAFYVDERKKVVSLIGQKLSLHPMTINLMSLLIEKDRARYLPAIALAFVRELDNRLLRVRATITTAQALSEADLKQIVGALFARIGKNVVPQTQVDPSVLGGVRAKIGGLIFDATLQTQLQNLRKNLVSSSLTAS